MSPWLYLLLAHLIADFVLQPYGLVQLKRQPIGLAIHAGIHGAVMVVLAAPILSRWWLVIPLVTVVHYAVDALKVGYGRPGGPRSFLLFLLDQGIHMAILALAVLLAGISLRTEVIYGSRAVTAMLYDAVPYVAATFGGTILLYQIALAFDTRTTPADLLTPRVRLVGMAERMLVLTVVLFLQPVWWWVGAVSYALRLGASHRLRGRWVESGSSLGFAIALGLLFR